MKSYYWFLAGFNICSLIVNIGFGSDKWKWSFYGLICCAIGFLTLELERKFNEESI